MERMSGSAGMDSYSLPDWKQREISIRLVHAFIPLQQRGHCRDTVLPSLREGGVKTEFGLAKRNVPQKSSVFDLLEETPISGGGGWIGKAAVGCYRSIN